MENFDFESLTIRGFYLPSNPHFMRLVPKADKESFEIKLVLLTLASCFLRRSDIKPTREQKEFLFSFIRFAIYEYPQHTTVRPAVSLFYEERSAAPLADLAMISQFDEFCAGQYEQLGDLTSVGAYSACMFVKEPAKVINVFYRQLLWNLVLEAPELLPANSGNYAMEILIFMDLLKGEKSSEYFE